MDEYLKTAAATATGLGMEIGVKVVGAVLLWIVGRLLIRMSKSLVAASMTKQKVDPTLVRYVGSTLGILLNIVLVIAMLSVFGVETTTFAGLLAAAGVAIGMAWSGLLANFAAGIFMIVLRPFKAGDMVTVGGVTGVVEEIGLFVTTINTSDNVRTFIGNNKIFGDTIQNYTTNPNRRVELVCQLDHTVDVRDAIRRLEERVTQIPNVHTSPAAQVSLLTFTLAGPVLAVRPYTHNANYWQVYFDTNLAIAEVCGAAGFPPPNQHLQIGGLK